MNAWLKPVFDGLKYLDNGVRSIPDWVTLHPLRFDLILLGVICFVIALLLGRQKRRMRRAHRLYRGIMMRRENLTLFQRMKIEDAIGDACLGMNLAGEMTDEQEKEWYRLFCVKMGMDGMVPRKSQYHLKKAIRARLYKLKYEADLFAIAVKNGMAKARFWGPTPAVKVDESYVLEDVALTSKSSKFHQAA